MDKNVCGRRLSFHILYIDRGPRECRPAIERGNEQK